MINIAEIVTDADFAQAFYIERSSGTFQLGGYVSTPSTIGSFGVIEPINSKDLAQVPEGDRVLGMIAVWNTQIMYTTHNDGSTSGLSDVITWQGQHYRIVQMREFSDYGYWKAICARMAGE